MIPWVRSLLIAQCHKSLSQEDFYPFLITPFGTLCLNRFSEKENTTQGHYSGKNVTFLPYTKKIQNSRPKTVTFIVLHPKIRD